ncbi:MAG TPA: glycosyltransferase family 4 protein [Candidatus Krumholzibacteria bacterium]|nr:glycosyltransferase family 4 protein [Candidatus Krumholzibacteria bacterium]
MESKRILFVSSLRRYGGGERWMLDTAAGLRERGHDVRLAARPGSVLAANAPARGIPLFSIEMRGDVDPIAITQFAGVLRRFQPEIVCPNLDREIRIAAASIRASRALRPRPVRPRLIPRRGSEFPLKDKRHYRLVYLLDINRVIVNSEATKRTMVKDAPWFPPEKAVVVYNGIDAAPYDRLVEQRDALRARLRGAIGAPPDAPVVSLVGELNERKQQRVVIEAAPHVLEKFPNARILFVGDGDDRAKLEAAVRERGLHPSIVFTGFRADVPEILTGSDALLLPSRVEGFGYVLVEAMAAGIPCIASRVSSIPEILEDGVTGILHAVGDSGAIADAVIDVLSDRERARAMGDAGARVAREKFTLTTMLDQVEKIFCS